MVTVPNPERRDVIMRSVFLNTDIGEMVAWHDEEGPTIDVRLAPADSEQRVDLALTPSETRQLAGQLTEIADAAQRAGWTPAVLAEVRERYLPGASDDDIIARLDRLTQRLGGHVLGYQGRVDSRAGRMLTAEVGTKALDRAAAAVDTAAERLAAFRQAVDQLTELRACLTELKRFYQAESETEQ